MWRRSILRSIKWSSARNSHSLPSNRTGLLRTTELTTPMKLTLTVSRAHANSSDTVDELDEIDIEPEKQNCAMRTKIAFNRAHRWCKKGKYKQCNHPAWAKPYIVSFTQPSTTSLGLDRPNCELKRLQFLHDDHPHLESVRGGHAARHDR